jgi:hypothetical protein
VSDPGPTSGPGEAGTPAHQVGASRDAYVAGRDQYIAPAPGDGKNGRGWYVVGVVFLAIGLLGAFILWFIIHSSPRLGPSPAAASKLEVDSINVESYTETHGGSQAQALVPGPVTLDFKLRNTGGQVALITGVDMRVSSVVYYPPCLACSPLIPISATYGYVLPLKAGPVQEIPLSEEVEPDAVDRFDLSLQLPPGTAAGARYDYVIYMSLIYNDDKNISLGYKSFTIYGGR